VSSGGEETHKRNMKRIKANDPAAITYMGEKCREEGKYNVAFEYWTKAAELGDIGARYNLGVMYEKGISVEKDIEKAVYHYEKAAIGGHPWARHNLACYEGRNGNEGRAVKHWIIAAKLGYEVSMQALWLKFRDGNITKEELEVTLRAHQAAIDETKSAERDAEAEVVFRK
jgi:TPR repeat protein